MSTDTRDHSDTDPRRLWHRAFGIALMDVFAEAPWAVELELEMALKSQLLEQLYRLYRREAPDMAYTLEQFIRETHEMVIDEAIRSDPEAILKRFDPKERLRGARSRHHRSLARQAAAKRLTSNRHRRPRSSGIPPRSLAGKSFLAQTAATTVERETEIQIKMSVI